MESITVFISSSLLTFISRSFFSLHQQYPRSSRGGCSICDPASRGLCCAVSHWPASRLPAKCQSGPKRCSLIPLQVPYGLDWTRPGWDGRRWLRVWSCFSPKGRKKINLEVVVFLPPCLPTHTWLLSAYMHGPSEIHHSCPGYQISIQSQGKCQFLALLLTHFTTI